MGKECDDTEYRNEWGRPNWKNYGEWLSECDSLSDTYYDSVFACKELRDELNKFALDAYGSHSNEAMQGGIDTGGSTDTDMPAKEPTNEINADFVKKEENKAPSKQPFSDEDIPF